MLHRPRDATRDKAARSFLVVALLSFFCLVSYRISQPSVVRSSAGAISRVYVFDECFYVFTASRLAQGDRDVWNVRSPLAVGRADRVVPDEVVKGAEYASNVAYEWTHPPMAKLVMATSIGAFGFGPGAYRGPSVALSLLALAMVHAIGRRLYGSRAALLSVGLLGIDGLFYVLTRTAMVEPYVLAAVASGTYGIVRLGQSGDRRFLLLVGSSIGFGIASKWSIAPLALFWSFASVWKIVKEVRTNSLSKVGSTTWILGALIVLPIAIYVASYVPMLRAGYAISEVIDLHKHMFRYHSQLATHPPGASPWYTWPLLAYPVKFYDVSTSGSLRAVVFAIGNPIVCWAFLPAWIVVIARWFRHRKFADGLIAASFAVAWLPAAFVSRPMFLYHFANALPFGVLCVASCLEPFLRSDSIRKRVGGWAYVALSVTAFVWLMPVLNATPISQVSLDRRLGWWTSLWPRAAGESSSTVELARDR